VRLSLGNIDLMDETIQAGMAGGEFQDRCLKPLGHPSFLAISNAYTNFRKARTTNSRGLAGVLPEQARVDAQCNVGLGVAKALGGGDDVEALVDQPRRTVCGSAWDVTSGTRSRANSLTVLFLGSSSVLPSAREMPET
jgi:hypothetical protein